MISVDVLYFGDDPQGILTYFNLMEHDGIYVTSVEGTFGGSARWELRFQTTQSGFEKLTDECDELGLTIASTSFDPSYYGSAPVGYVFPTDMSMTAEKYTKTDSYLQGQIAAASGLPVLEGVIESPKNKSPKKKSPPDTGRYFDMDFDDSDLT